MNAYEQPIIKVITNGVKLTPKSAANSSAMGYKIAAAAALVTTLVEEPGIELAGAVTDGPQLIDFAAEAAVDLVLFDQRLPGLPVETLVASLCALEPRPILVAMSNDYEEGRRILRMGADAFVSKGDQPDWLLETLRHYAQRANLGSLST